MGSLSAAGPKIDSDRVDALLQLGKKVALCYNCEDAKSTLLKELREIASFDYLHLLAFEKAGKNADWQMLHFESGLVEVNSQNGADSSAVAWAQQVSQPTVIHNWETESKFAEFREFFLDLRIATSCSFPLIWSGRRLGVITFGSVLPSFYSAEEARFLSRVADQLALVLDAAVNLHSSELLQDRMRLILDLTNQVVSNLKLDDLLHAISASVRRVMGCDAAAVMLPDEEGKNLRVHALDYPDSKGIFVEGAF